MHFFDRYIPTRNDKTIALLCMFLIVLTKASRTSEVVIKGLIKSFHSLKVVTTINEYRMQDLLKFIQDSKFVR